MCVLVVFLPFALWVGSFILRAAVGLTNKILGGAAPSDLDYYDEPSDFRYGGYARTPTRSGLATPVPSIGRAMGILLLTGLVDFAVRCGIMLAAGAGSAFGAAGGNAGMGQAMASLIGIPVSLVVHIAMLSSLLPTTLGRAFLVVLFQFLIVFAICLLIGVAVVALAAGRAGMR
jgi:hypothetical protein